MKRHSEWPNLESLWCLYWVIYSSQQKNHTWKMVESDVGCSRRVRHPWIDTPLAPLVNFMEESLSN